MKKLVSLTLVVLLVFLFAVPAFAFAGRFNYTHGGCDYPVVEWNDGPTKCDEDYDDNRDDVDYGKDVYSPEFVPVVIVDEAVSPQTGVNDNIALACILAVVSLSMVCASVVFVNKAKN